MKLYFSLLLIVILSSCFHFDKLEYYVDGYSPNNDSLRTDGYYYQQSTDSSVLNYWPNAVRDWYFLENGTYVDNGNCDSENLDSLDASICKYNVTGSYLGQYTIQNDTILIEWLYPTNSFIVPLNANRFHYKAVQTEKGVRIFEMDGFPVNEEWLFQENDCVPDSVKNWITNHRKYRLSE